MKKLLGALVFIIGAVAAFALVCAGLDFKRQSYPVYITLKRTASEE